jgi:hypothetical protein
LVPIAWSGKREWQQSNNDGFNAHTLFGNRWTRFVTRRRFDFESPREMGHYDKCLPRRQHRLNFLKWTEAENRLFLERHKECTGNWKLIILFFKSGFL